MSMWVIKSVERAKIVDYCCEVRRGSEGSSSILESEGGPAPNFPQEIVSYLFKIREKSSFIRVMYLKEMKSSKWNISQKLTETLA